MVNVPGRSKGCVTCRKRKIKCDESHPGCSQCLKLGLCCPGPRMGAFFVHALPGSTTLTKPTAEQTPLDLTASIVAGKHCWLTRNQYVAPRLPSCHQPSRADLFDQLFVSHFIESFGFRESSDERTPSTWLDSLALFITSPSQDLVKTSIRAGSMFFYGSLVDDVSIRTEANKWYVKALQGLRCLLTQQASEFTGDVICSAVMLAHYETTAGTSDEAWFQHVQGAARMLQSGGPASCRDGFLHQLFRHLRLLAFTAAFFKSQQHVFSSPEWLTVPFEMHPKTAFDEFVDIMLTLLPGLGMANELIASTSIGKTRLTKRVRRLMSQLHSWWIKSVLSTNFMGANGDLWMGSSNDEIQDLPGDPKHVPLVPYVDMPTASLAALYDAVNIIVLRLFFLVSPSATLYESRIQGHMQSILSAKEFVATLPNPASSRGAVMMGLPLKMVTIWNPLDKITSTQCPLPDLTGQYEGGTVPYPPSREFFGDVASYVLQRYNSEKPITCVSENKY